MKFLVVTFAPTLKKEESYYSYAPYVDEMNIWIKYTDEFGIISPVKYNEELLIAPFKTNPKVFPILSFSLTSFISILKSIFIVPIVLIKIYKAMRWADHIHLRCPGNVGLLGCLVQIVFPNKPKTVKYAGNWDPKSKQPLSYRIQKWIISNTFLTKNCKVLVYGKWENQSKNIIPFFTATYAKKDIVAIAKKDFSKKIRFIFVGALSMGKQPLISVKVVQKLKNKGYNVQLDMYGDGVERKRVENHIKDNNLGETVIMHGNVTKNEVKKAFQKSHFLVFISKSEGWPKVVAEAMFWSCLPITTFVSCVPYMVDFGNRGALVKPKVNKIVTQIELYFQDDKLYQQQVNNAKNWAQQFTLEKFESEIKNILLSDIV